VRKIVLLAAFSLFATACGIESPEAGDVRKPQPAQAKQALKCSLDGSDSSFICRPDAPPSFADCAGDTNAYDGEFVIFTGTNYTGYCFWTHPAGTLSLPNLADMDLNNPSFHIRSYKSRTHQSGNLHDGNNYSGVFWHTLPGSDSVPNFTSFQPSSLSIGN
jgi:hypothetical protein